MIITVPLALALVIGLAQEPRAEKIAVSLRVVDESGAPIAGASLSDA